MINITRTAAVDTEQVIHTGRCRLLAILQELTTTGTLTVRNGEAGTTVHVAAVGLAQEGKHFDGARLGTGLTIEQSVASDRCAIIWEAL